MKKQIKFSIIMAVSNLSERMAESLGGIISQTYGEFELIVIDDCSTDRTAEIVKGFTERDDRITLIRHDEPKGIFVARNEGIKLATGDYILFVDPRDFAHRHWLAVIAAAIGKGEPIDVLLYSYGEIWKDYEMTREYKLSDLVYEDSCFTTRDPMTMNKLVTQLMELGAFSKSCNKAYRRDFLIENSLCYSEVFYLENVLFNLDVWGKAKTMTLISDVLYCSRREHIYQIPADKLEVYFTAQCYTLEKIFNQQKQWHADEEVLPDLAKAYFGGFVYLIIDMVVEKLADEDILRWCRDKAQNKWFDELRPHLPYGEDRESRMRLCASQKDFKTILDAARMLLNM